MVWPVLPGAMQAIRRDFLSRGIPALLNNPNERPPPHFSAHLLAPRQFPEFVHPPLNRLSSDS